MRMFVAAVPPEEALEDLDAFLAVRRDAAPFRWTPAEHWHLTLAFIEHLPERKLDDLLARLQRAARKRTAMQARIAGGGAFPHVGRAKVLWSGVEVATMIRSTESAGIPAWVSARRAASAPSERVVSPSPAMWRAAIPLRSTIHSSLVSTILLNSALVITRCGRAEPHPAMTDLTAQAVVVLAALVAATAPSGARALLVVPAAAAQALLPRRRAADVPLVLPGRTTDVVHPVRPRAPGRV